MIRRVSANQANSNPCHALVHTRPPGAMNNPSSSSASPPRSAPSVIDSVVAARAAAAPERGLDAFLARAELAKVGLILRFIAPTQNGAPGVQRVRRRLHTLTGHACVPRHVCSLSRSGSSWIPRDALSPTRPPPERVRLRGSLAPLCTAPRFMPACCPAPAVQTLITLFFRPDRSPARCAPACRMRPTRPQTTSHTFPCRSSSSSKRQTRPDRRLHHPLLVPTP